MCCSEFDWTYLALVNMVMKVHFFCKRRKIYHELNDY
jgi:hypothetical protein